MADIRGILLAAGFSRRFGSDKLLAVLQGSPEGAREPLALAAARNLVAAIPDSIAVVRAGAEGLERMLREAGCATVLCEHAAEGMGASLAAGVRAASGADGWVIALADMPFARPESIRRVVQSLAAGAQIAAPVFRGQRGHPVGFSRRFFEDLIAVRGDEGARSLLQAHSALVTTVEVDDPGVLRDIDTPGDLVECEGNGNNKC